MTSVCWISYLVIYLASQSLFSLAQLQGMVAEQRMRPKWKQYCTFNNALRCHPTIVAQSADGIGTQGWKIYRSPQTKDYYVGITCPQRCWQNIRVYSDMQSYNGVATLSFYYYIWERPEKTSDGLLPELRIKGCRDQVLWRSGNQPGQSQGQSEDMGEWIGVVLPIHCTDTFSVIFEGTMTSAGQVIAVDNVVLSDGRAFSNVLPQPSINVVHPTLPPSPGRPRPPRPRPPIAPTHRTYPTVGPPLATHIPSQRPGVHPGMPEVYSPRPRPTPKTGTTQKSDGNSTTIPKLLVALALCICAATICIHCIIYKRQKRCHNMKRCNSISNSVGPSTAPAHGQLSSTPSVCEIVITDLSRNSWAVNRCDDPDRPSTSRGLTADYFPACRRPRLATCTLGVKEFNKDLDRVSELRPSGRACSLPSRPTPNIYESIDEVRSGLKSHPSNFFLNLSKRSTFVKKVVNTLEMPFRKTHLDKSRASFLLTKERSSSESRKGDFGNHFRRPFMKSFSHSGGVRLAPSSLTSLNNIPSTSSARTTITDDPNTLSPNKPLPKRPFSNIFLKQHRLGSFTSSTGISRSHSDVNQNRKRVTSFVSPYSCSKLPNISFHENDPRPNVHFAKTSSDSSPEESMNEAHNETTVSSRISEHFYHDLDSQARPNVTPNHYQVLDLSSYETSSSEEDDFYDGLRTTPKRNTVIRRTESGYTVVSKNSGQSDFEQSVNSSLSNGNDLDRVYFRLESLENSHENFDFDYGVRDGLLDHEFDLSSDLRDRSQKLSSRRVSDLETTCTLSMYEESGRLLDETDVSTAMTAGDDRPDVLKDVKT